MTNLTLSFNKLTEVPKGLEKLTQLTELNLGYNYLFKLPEGLEKLTQLEILELENNPALTKAQIEKSSDGIAEVQNRTQRKVVTPPLPSSTRSSQVNHQSW